MHVDAGSSITFENRIFTKYETKGHSKSSITKKKTTTRFSTRNDLLSFSTGICQQLYLRLITKCDCGKHLTKSDVEKKTRPSMKRALNAFWAENTFGLFAFGYFSVVGIPRSQHIICHEYSVWFFQQIRCKQKCQ